MTKKGDISLEEDLIQALKHLCSIEHHSMASFGINNDNKFLELNDEVRKIRSKWLEIITKKEKSQIWCFAPETKIIINGGLKDIKDIKEGDLVFTHNNNWKKVTKTIVRNYFGDIINIKTNYSNIDLRVSGNHLFYVAENLRKPQDSNWKKNYKKPNFVWKSAETLNRNDFIYLPRYNIEKDINEMSSEYCWMIGNNNHSSIMNFKVSNELMYLIGLYIAEGHYTKRVNKEGYNHECIGFTLNLKEKDIADKVVDYFKKVFNYDAKYFEHRGNTLNFAIGKRAITQFFKQFGNGCTNKTIPPWVLNLPKQKLSSLIKGLFDGDGSVSKFSFLYSTVSKDLAFQIRLILNKLGLLSNISVRKLCKDSLIKGRLIKSKNIPYTIQVSGNSARELAKIIGQDYNSGRITSGQFGYIGDKYFLIPVISIKKESYNGKLYNLEVEDDESYATFNGVAHNCINKHILNSITTLEEVGTRLYSLGKIEQSKEAYNDAKVLFLLLLELNEIGGKK